MFDQTLICPRFHLIDNKFKFLSSGYNINKFVICTAKSIFNRNEIHSIKKNEKWKEKMLSVKLNERETISVA